MGKIMLHLLFDDNLMVSIHTKKNLFEIGDLFHSLLKPNSCEKLFSDINSILQMIEYFKLDEKTGL